MISVDNILTPLPWITFIPHMLAVKIMSSRRHWHLNPQDKCDTRVSRTWPYRTTYRDE